MVVICPRPIQGENPRVQNGYLVFNGSMDGDRQVDPQIAVGGRYILEGSNKGLIIYNKKEGRVCRRCFSKVLQQRD